MKLLNWKNCLLLSLISYSLYTILWLSIDDQVWRGWKQGSIGLETAVDFGLCLIFTLFSLFYNYLAFRFLPMKRQPYNRLIIYASILFLVNNLMAYMMTDLCDNFIWGGMGGEFRLKGVYTYGMIATFISCIYSNAFYLDFYLKTDDKKQKLEIDLLKEKEIALQSQLNALKSQIDAHFLFNNFSILSELIEEDQELAGKFLANLSKVYRYVIQNLERNTITIAEEVEFLDAYNYLIQMRYGEAVIVSIDDKLRTGTGFIPPVSLQQLVENAIKHNRHSKESPLSINILRTDDYVIVSNVISPLLSWSGIEPTTAIGQKNISDRYSLLGSKEVIISLTDQTYSVKLPIL